MNNNHSFGRIRRRHGFAVGRLAMAAAIAISGVVASAAAEAQDTAGRVFGKAPAGETVLVQSSANGLQHEGQVNAKGRYAINRLPVGVYTVTLEKGGQPVARHLNVGVVVGRGSRVDFNCAEGQCGETASRQ